MLLVLCQLNVVNIFKVFQVPKFPKIRRRTGIRADFGNMFGCQNWPLDGCTHLALFLACWPAEQSRELLEQTKVHYMDFSPPGGDGRFDSGGVFVIRFRNFLANQFSMS